MPVDFTKPAHYLVVHGVETGHDADQHQDQLIATLVGKCAVNVMTPPTTELYAYKDINNRDEQPVEMLMNLILQTKPYTVVVDDAIQLVGDVVNSLANGSTAELVREGLRSAIDAGYRQGLPTYIVAHSLGSIYAFDVINELITDPRYYDPNDRTTWPVQALLTMGSPIGLKMFNSTRPSVMPIRSGNYQFRWHNYFDPNDPIVSGSIFGTNENPRQIATNYYRPGCGWAISDFSIDTGKFWLLAHTAYWDQTDIGVDLVWLTSH